MTTLARARLREIAAQPEAAIDLGEAAFVLAWEEYPELAVAGQIARLDQMAEHVRERGPFPDPADAAQALGQYLFDELGFTGNTDDYYDPRNSFLNDVLDRRVGIPISLSVVYLELARRLGLAAEGVGMPGHFLVRVSAPGWLIDPFNRGERLTEQDCRERLATTYGARLEFSSELLASVGPRAILARMLANLKQIYLGRRDYPRTLAAIDRILLLAPDAWNELRDRGVIQAQQGNLRAAIADLESYLGKTPDAADAGEIRQVVRRLWERQVQLN